MYVVEAIEEYSDDVQRTAMMENHGRHGLSLAFMAFPKRLTVAERKLARQASNAKYYQRYVFLSRVCLYSSKNFPEIRSQSRLIDVKNIGRFRLSWSR